MIMNRKLSAAATLISALAATNALGQVSNWASAVNGNWEIAGNWDNGIPTAPGQIAALGLTGAYTVGLNSNQSIDSVSITNPDAVLSIAPGRTLTLGGSSSTNNGSIRLNIPASSANSVLSISGSHTMNGSGEIRLATSFDDSQIAGAGTLTNGSSHTIRGVGRLVVDLVNNGLISGDTSVASFGNNLEVLGDTTNNAFMRAEAGSILSLTGVTIDQSGGGSIVAANTGFVNVTNSGATILGGTIDTEGNGEFSVLAGGVAVLTSVYSGGFIDIEPAGRVNVTGSGLFNDGVIALNRPASSADAILNFLDSGDLDGTGEVRMQTQFGDTQLNTAAGMTITQGASHTIRGVGDINASLVNDGLIAADVSVSSFGNNLALQTNNKVNNNQIGAAAGSNLNISGITVDQTAGGMMFANDGTINLGNAIIDGGVFTATGTGSMQTSSGTSSLSGMTLNGPLGLNAGHTIQVDGDGMVNNNIISMNSQASSADAIMKFTANAALDGTGEIRMRSQGADTQLNTEPTFVITHSATHLITGVGEINAGMINNGEIRADTSVAAFGNWLDLRTNDKVNNNLMGAAAGSDLYITGITIDQTAGGMMYANDGAIRLNNATIDGGVFTATGTGSMQTFSGVSSLSGMTLNGPLGLNAGHTILVDGDGLTNNGILSMNPQASAADAIMNFTDNATLDGTGEINLKSQGGDTQLNSDPTFVVVQGADHTIRGVGYVGAALDNYGTISADTSVATFGNILTLLGEDKVNRSEITAEAGSILDVTGIKLTQVGAGVLRANDGQIRFNGPATLDGNSIEFSGSGNYLVNGPVTFHNITSNTPGAIAANQTLTISSSGFVNNNYLRVNPVQSAADALLKFPSNGVLSGTGEVNLFAGFNDSQIAGPGTVTNASGHTISGYGAVSAPLINQGTLSPGTNDVSTLRASSGVTLDPTSILNIELAGNNSADRLAVTGTANLGGTLDVSMFGALVPTLNFDYTILTATSVVGTFANENIIVDGNLITRIVYEPTQVRILTRCIADTNLDGAVTAADFSAWVAAFNSGSKIADQNLDGNVSPADFSAWVANFNQGCP